MGLPTCGRCGLREGIPRYQRADVRDLQAWNVVEQTVVLCGPCSGQAELENKAAAARRTIRRNQ